MFAAIQGTIVRDVALWRDPAWQLRLDRQASAVGLDVDLVGGSGTPVHTSATDPLAPRKTPAGPRPTDRLVCTLFVGGDVADAGTARLYSYPIKIAAEESSIPRVVLDLLPFIGLVALALTTAAVIWAVGPAVLRPLAAMSQAAGEVAHGNLDVELPASRLYEVAEFSSAFTTMGDLRTPLYRGERSRNRGTGGAGLGLTIAHRILTAHGGTLTAANGATGGAVFTSSLPLRAPQPSHDERFSGTPAGAARDWPLDDIDLPKCRESPAIVCRQDQECEG